MRIRLDLAYDGTNFSGWAKQPSKRTCQEELETALAKILPGMWGQSVPTIVAGRTDAGVHARGQVVHFDYAGFSAGSSEGLLDLDSTSALGLSVDPPCLPPSSVFNEADLLYKFQCVLPSDIVVRAATQVHPEFSARFWAKSRTYKYRICDNVASRDPLRRLDTFWAKKPLDVNLMNEAAKPLEGLHDFAAFVKPRKGATSVRDLLEFSFEREQLGPDQGLIVAKLRADAFAYNMVRSLVGAAILVGSDQRPPQWMFERLKSGIRQGATGPIAAKGLTLEKIEFEKDPAKAIAREKAIKLRRELTI